MRFYILYFNFVILLYLFFTYSSLHLNSDTHGPQHRKTVLGLSILCAFLLSISESRLDTVCRVSESYEKGMYAIWRVSNNPS